MHLLAPGTGRVDAAGGVTGQKPPLDGTLQGGVEGDVVVPDGPGAETTLSVPPTPAPPPAGTHILNFSYNFYGPYAIATDGDEFVYVSDRDQILNTCAGFGIATDANNNVYITDLSTDRVRKFDSMGNAISSWTGGGSGFYNPRGIDIDLSGDVYVVDNDNQQIQKSNGNSSFIALWAAGNNPMDVAVDNFGSVYSTDSSLGIVSKWTSGE